MKSESASEELCLDRLRPSELAVIVRYLDRQDIHHRLKELGMVPGTKIRMMRYAPLGDPMELELRGYRLSIRREDAEKIWVRKIKISPL